MRAGHFVKQHAGYSAFIPAPLPPDPPVKMDSELIRLLSDADRSLGRLDGVATNLPNPDMFVAMYVRQEAVLSSQIEGTQSTLEDVLQFEADIQGREAPKDVGEVVNYIHAMNYGLERLKMLPLSLRLIREIHAQLLKGVRGAHRAPGEFRKSQNWIGPEGCTPSTAVYVPPPVHEMHSALGNLEIFLHESGDLPELIVCGLAHAQFETIHPFLDGNGRLGRLLIAFQLCHRAILQRPLLYLSHYFKLHRGEYYDRLMTIRINGDWEGWLKFFLRGVAEVSREATHTARNILNLREQLRTLTQEELGGAANMYKLIDYLFRRPIINVRLVEKELGCSFVTAAKLIKELILRQALVEMTGQKRNRLYRFEPYLTLFTNPKTTDSKHQRIHSISHPNMETAID